MGKISRKLNEISNLLGFNPSTFSNFIKGLPRYYRDYRVLKKQLAGNSDFSFGRLSPMLADNSTESGVMKGNYFHQDLLIARRVYENGPVRHIDIGSRIDGFVAHVAVFREIEIMDIRPLTSTLKNVRFYQADLTLLQPNMAECCDSISSLHAIEHFGLGRYGDPIDSDGHLKAISNIHAMLQPDGKFYFSVPIGRQRIEFNEQRVFSVRYLLDILSEKFVVENFNYVDDQGGLFENVSLTEEAISRNFDCNYYGCGIFELRKPAAITSTESSANNR